MMPTDQDTFFVTFDMWSEKASLLFNIRLEGIGRNRLLVKVCHYLKLE